MFGKLYDRLGSLNLGLWLMVGVLVLLGIGSFTGGGAARNSINDLPLFLWLQGAPLSASWWLWLTMLLLAFLALNTVLCSVESLRRKYRQTGFLVLMAPQVMHAGFLLIVLAHLFSAVGGFKQVLQLNDGAEIVFPDGRPVQIANLRLAAGPMGMPTDLSAEVRYPAGNGVGVRTIRPNHPFFYQGFGIYLKEVALYPMRVALIEIHREPGAGLALAGAFLFTVGNIVLLAVRRGR
ncbi:cytochrome C biogenesis protein ResB [bacterium]|nr:MAG: cytochrome C biogenesis protein ResB [bacterium]